MSRHKLLASTTQTGSDTLKFYDAGDGDIYIVHVQEWADLDSSAESEGYGKYNVVAHHVNVHGFDCPTSADGHRIVGAIGQSVRDSLKSCGWELFGQYNPDTNVTVRGITNTYDGATVVKAGDWKALVLCIAEAMYGYGAGARVHDDSGNNARKLEREARGAF